MQNHVIKFDSFFSMCCFSDLSDESHGLHDHMGSHPIFGVVRVAHRFIVRCWVVCFVYLRPTSCVPNVASFSGFSMLDCPNKSPMTTPNTAQSKLYYEVIFETTKKWLYLKSYLLLKVNSYEIF